MAIATCDLIELTSQLRELACALLPLPPEHVLLTATHTHCGPAHLASPQHRELVTHLADGVARASAPH